MTNQQGDTDVITHARRTAVHTPRRVASPLALAILALLAIAVPSASAAAVPKHPFQEAFGSTQQPGFAFPLGMAVDRSDGDLYVIDVGGNDKQKVVFSGVEAATTFKLSNLPGSPCTASETGVITYTNTTTAKINIEKALQALCGSSNVAVTGTGTAGVKVEFKGATFEKKAQSLIVCTKESGGGSCSIEHEQSGHATGVYRYKENGEPDNFTAGPNAGTNVLTGLAFNNGAAGAPEVQVAVDNSGKATNGNIYVAQGEKGPVKIFASTGEPHGELTESSEGGFGKACGVAVDSSGNVYVGDHSGEVHKYEPAGSFPVNGDNHANFAAESACALAAGAGPTAGSLFVDEGSTKVAKLNAGSGVQQGTLTVGAPTISLDPGTGHLYVASESKFREYNFSGATATEVSNTPTGTIAFGVAVNWASGNVYTTRTGNPNIQTWAPTGGHHFQEVFGSSVQPGFAFPLGMAVDRSDGDLYVIDVGGNDKQKVVFSGVEEATTFKLSNLPGSPCTASETGVITYTNTTAAKVNIEKALQALCGSSNVAVTGTGTAGVKVEFKGATFEKKAQPLIVCAKESGGGSCSVQREQSGHVTGLYRYKENGEPDNFTAGPNAGTNVLTGLAFNNGLLGFPEVQVAVDNSGKATNGNIYVAQGEKGPVKIFASTGEPHGELSESSEGAFGKACGVAVDPSGNVYVGDHSGEVHKYEPAGSFPVNGDNHANFAAESACALAAGAGPTAGSLFVDEAQTKVAKLNASSGAQQGSLTVIAGTISVDPGTGHLYVASASNLREYNFSGVTATEVSNTPLGTTDFGIAVNWASGNVYTTRTGNPNIQTWAPTAEHTITVAVAGSGKVSETAASASATPPVSGSISNCTSAGGSSCIATYFVGEEPEFEAHAEEHNHLVGWSTVEHVASTTCAGATTPCKVKLKSEPGSENVTAAVEFASSPTHAVTVTVTGSGEVNASALPVPASGSISHCTAISGTCSASYYEGEEPELEATPAPNNHFAGWLVAGDASTGCTGTTSPCKVKIGTNEVTALAEFASNGIPLTIEKPGSGEGTVTSTESGVNSQKLECGGHCSETFTVGEKVHLTATASAHSQFTGWTTTEGNPGTCTGTTSPCEVAMSEAVKLQVGFAAITHTFGVSVVGSGSVECKEEGGFFGSCAVPFDEGHKVTVRDTAAAHWHFVEYKSGGGSASACDATTVSECTFTIEADSTLTATNAQTTHTFGVSVEGSGSVECKQDSGSYGSCAVPFDEGHQVTVRDTAAAHWRFVEYKSGGGSASACDATTVSECTFTIEADSTLTATNAQTTHTFGVSVEGSGSVECKQDSGSYGSCAVPFDEGHQVTVRDTAAAHWRFVEYKSGGGSASACDATTVSECTFTIEADSTLTATNAQTTRTLTIVTTGGSGSGQVNCEVNGGPTVDEPCLSEYPDGTQLRLLPHPTAGSALVEFENGTGPAGGCEHTATCEFTLEGADAAVDAPFDLIAHPSTLTVFKGGNGTGTVTSLAPHTGISCGPACEEAQASFEEGQTIELEASPKSGSVFAGWIGCRHVAATTCQVKLGSPEVEATAVFLKEGEKGEAGTPGETPTISEFSGAKGPCAAGGVEVKIGSTTAYACDGEKGAAGANGTSGETPTITQFSGAKGTCSEGGVEVKVGSSTTYVCNGVQGVNGTSGETPTVTQFSGAKGTCAEGGVEVKVGSSTTYVCDGVQGVNGTSGETPTIATLPIGNAHCANGGIEVTLGSNHTYVCTGERGEHGHVGLPGAEGETGAAGAQGERGAGGAQGAAGPVGPAGAAGPQGAKGETGPTGKVTCAVKQHGNKARVTCTIQYASSKAKASALRWVLIHGGRVVAHGKSGRTPRINLGALRRGRYTLYLQGQRKGEVIHVG